MIGEIIQIPQNATLESRIQEEKKIPKRHLMNILNYINFQDGTIRINLKHKLYNNTISLEAKPQPCLDDRLNCFWIEKEALQQRITSYEFLHFITTDGQKMILVKPELKSINEEGISFYLPDTCYEFSFRKVKRHVCKDIHVEFIQNSVIFHGYLLEFNAFSFSVEISIDPPQTFHWVNPESEILITLKKNQDILYSGECKIIRQTWAQKKRTFVLKPINDQMPRFKPKEFRSPRHKLSPSPNIIFTHPLTGELINLKVEDISGSGFSVEELYDNSLLLPGMIIPELEIEYAKNCTLNCKAQVVYRNIFKAEEGSFVKSGIAILDMDIQDQGKLSSLLHQATDKKSYVCSKVDLDALWKFFFEAGFVYPEKYDFIQANKEKFKETYRKLYLENPNIARHFLYQDNGIIHGHISMLRFYKNTWLFHHHVATGSKFSRAGLIVLDQISRYVNDFYCLFSTHMNFVISYFRPENKFPSRVFGDFTKYLNNPKRCSFDQFAYFRFPKSFEQFIKIKVHNTELIKAQPEDLSELGSFYEHKSGGLMFHALDLEPDMIENNELNNEYLKLGFKRERHVFSLKRYGDLKAIITVNVSDIGLNMSNVNDCIQVFVINSDDLHRNILYYFLSLLTKYYEQNEIPVLLYPVSYAISQSIPYEKVYNLWVISTQYTDSYLKYMETFFKRGNKGNNKNNVEILQSS